MANKIFKKEDILAGYLLRCVDLKTKELFNMSIVPIKVEALGAAAASMLYNCPYETGNTLGCIAPGGHYFPLSRFDGNLVHIKGLYQVQEVYGLTFANFAMDNSTEGRDLLWKREEPKPAKKMTLEEIAKALGYEVEII